MENKKNYSKKKMIQNDNKSKQKDITNFPNISALP